MTIDEIKAAIEADKASLHETFLKYAQERGIMLTSPKYAETYRAWEWCRRQLEGRGVAGDVAITKMRDAFQNWGLNKYDAVDQESWPNNLYEAVRECLFSTP